MDSFTRYAGLEDKTVFVTGGGSGIGASIVEHFCQQGSRVVFVDIAIEASAALVERIAESGARRPEFIECDLTDVVALRRVIVGVPDRHGSVTVLVNNAANDDRHAVADVTPEYWDNRMAVNLRHQFFAAQAVYPQMKEAGGGSIINFGSLEISRARITFCKLPPENKRTEVSMLGTMMAYSSLRRVA